jgi:Ca-activated chloride channel family protein
VADLAQLLKGAAPYDERDVTLGDLAERVDALVEADVPGAAGVAAMIRLAERGRSEPAPPGDGPPIR